MTVVDSIRTCFQKYFDFSGRASRSEFWWFFLCAFIAQWVVGVILPGIISLVLICPFLAVSARRLHDTGRSAWWLTSYLVSGMAITVVAAAGLVAAFAGADFLAESLFENAQSAELVVVMILVGLAAGIAAFLLPPILCTLPGTVGPNRFGDDPLPQPPQPGISKVSPADPVAPGASVERVERPRFCARCGSSFEPDTKFCASCGAAV